ncbi:MAG: hypothetical protein OHK0039_15500 [Bacteroidia bacterium]
MGQEADIWGMKPLIHAPLFKVALCLLLGILLADLLGSWAACIAPPALLGFLAMLRKDRRSLSQGYEIRLSLLIFLAAIGVGAARHWTATLPDRTPGLEVVNCERVFLAGTLRGNVKTYPDGGRRARLDVWAARRDSTWQAIGGQILLSIPATIDTLIAPFDTVFVEADVRDLHSPHASYLKYMHRQGVYHRAYVQRLGLKGREAGIRAYCYDWQQRLSDRLAAQLTDSSIVGIAQAMFLGDKDALDTETRDNFAAAGVSHVLAISGLHVGIIFLFLNILLMPLQLLPQGRRIKHVVILAMLLVYMMITGASPAVVRAVLMFVTILIFRITYSRYHMLNLLAISGMLQMLHDPLVVFDIGFQLSYAAVIGIVTLLPRFEAAVESPWPVVNKFYGWIGVTLVATLATLPLVLMHFGRFPTYFLAANILVSLISFVVVLTGFLTVILGWIPGVGTVLGALCTFELQVLRLIADETSKLPHAVLDSSNWAGPGLLMVGLQLAVATLLLLLPKLKLPRRRAAAPAPAPAWTPS